MKVCIAGKNRIAVEAAKLFLLKYPEVELLACKNLNDDGVNSWQPSFSYFCNRYNIPVVSLKELYELDDLLFISLEFARIVKPEKFKSTKLFNIHFSKLPAYKGMYTSVMPLINGEHTSGVTLHYIDKGIDTGNIIDQVEFPLTLQTTARDLYELYLEHSIKIFSKNIELLISGEITGSPQSAIGSTYYSKSTLNFSKLLVDLKKTAFEIHNQIRAFTFRDYQLPVIQGFKIYKSEIIAEPAQDKAGSIVVSNPEYIVINAIDYQIKLFIDRQDELLKIAEKGIINKYVEIFNTRYPVDVRTKQGWDIFIVACYNNQKSFVEYLLNEGWDVNTANYKGTSALMYAMTAGSKTNDLSTMKLLAPVANWMHKDDSENDVYYYASMYKNKEVIDFVNQYKN